MQANYYYLKPLAARLNGLLKGLVLAECFSQDKDCLLYTSPSPRD